MSKDLSQKKGTPNWLLIIICLCFLFSAYVFSIFNPSNRYNLLDDGVISERHYQDAKQSEKEGKAEQAKYGYKRALRFNPYHRQAKEALQKLNK